MFTCLLAFYMFTLSDAKPSPNYYRPQRSCGQGYVFTRVCDSVNRGGCLRRAPPDKADPPRDQGEPPRTRQTPPRDQGETPPGPGRPPRPGTRQNPPGPGRPPRPRRTPPPPDQADPPGPRRTPPGTRQTPPDQGEPPPGRTLQHTVNERPVRILLECILVLCTNLQVSRDLLDNEILFMNYCVCL